MRFSKSMLGVNNKYLDLNEGSSELRAALGAARVDESHWRAGIASIFHGVVGFGGISCCGLVLAGNRGAGVIVGRLSPRRAGSEGPWSQGQRGRVSLARVLCA